jgi:Flp pilus assembly protein TadD
LANGNTAEAIETLKGAAQREDATEKHVVTPGPLLPAREILAEVLLEAGKGGEALREYQAVMSKEPHRYRATLGAARAARLAGDAEKARLYFMQLVELGKSADTQRDSLLEARQFLAQK